MFTKKGWLLFSILSILTIILLSVTIRDPTLAFHNNSVKKEILGNSFHCIYIMNNKGLSEKLESISSPIVYRNSNNKIIGVSFTNGITHRTEYRKISENTYFVLSQYFLTKK